MINKSDESNKDLDEILQKASDLELDIYERLISLCKVNGGTRPISIYVALLEEGKSYASASGDPKNEMRKACILHLIKLVRSGVLLHDGLDNGAFTDYTLFKPANNDKFRYFCSIITQIEKERRCNRFSDLAIELASFPEGEF
jgi:hypothetical protein